MPRTLLIVSLLALGLTAASAPAAIINVPADHATIQGAIVAAAVNGDEIIVAPGTYPELINFQGKAVHLHSASGNPADTIIDGTGLSGSVVHCGTGEGPGTILEGFTITGGNTNVGGGMRNFNSSPTITNCTFSGNTATTSGGGMYNAGTFTNPTITNCTFSGNTANNDGGGMYNSSSSTTITNCTFSGNTAAVGGGMFNEFSSPTITNCTFSGNTAAAGGGMFNQSSSSSSSSPTITNCTFSGNTAASGGGLYNFGTFTNPTITNCTFSGNTADSKGGGLFNQNGSPTITNCTFSGNTALNFGGGMHNISGNLAITNCTFSRNTVPGIIGGGGMYIQGSGAPGSPRITNCIFWADSPNEIGNPSSSSTISFSNVQGGLPAGSIDGGGNLDLDPFFIDADGADNIPGTPDDDLRLADFSPGTDAGDNTAPGLAGITTDLDGNPRFYDDLGVADTGVGPAPIVDMGAYERQIDSSLTLINVPADFATIQGAIDAVVITGGEIIVAPGTYFEIINFNGKAVHLHSASGNPADTIIDGTGLNESVVLCISGEGPGTILEGFTITGGTTGHSDGFGALSGGGMFNSGSSPTVINCIFRGNSVSSNGGGGMFNQSSSHPSLTNCIFSGNTAQWGGGLYNNSGSNPMVTNCSFSGNTAINDGGGMLNQLSSHPIITNCIFWADSLNEIVNFDPGSTTTISFSNVLGGLGAGSIDGGGNLDLDPLFIDANGIDNIPGTPDDDLRLSDFSPCTDAGDNDATGLIGITTDLEGNPRFYDELSVADTGVGPAPIVDMGAYERQVDSVYTTISVPGDFATIQGAIVAAAVSGDDIIVAPGTYPELINFNGKTVYLHSASGNPADTIIDGTGLGNSVVQCVSGEGPGTILEGFTITGGTTGHSDGFGTLSGGGMYNEGSSPTVINCIFRGNSVTSNGGGGVFNNSSHPSITNCIFSGNTAQWGGGLYNISGSNPMVTNCTFSGNTAINDGGGMINQLSSHPTITNCIFWGDSLSEIVNFDPGSTTTISFSNVQGGLGAGSIDGGGNLDLDPLFINPLGPDATPGTPDDDLRLSGFSPCTDAGDNTAPGLIGITTDLDGNPRFYDDLGVADSGAGAPGAPIVDLGAYERQVDSDNTTINVPGDIGTIQGAINVVVITGGEIIIAPGTYSELINFNGKAVYLHSASGNPANTIIDGTGFNGSVVLCISGEGPGTILEGFTIRGGNALDGGGMRNFQSSPTITNCTFSGNSANFNGGGMHNNNSNPTITNCIFSGNTASVLGGGIYNWGSSSPTITNCTFSGNAASVNGGGMRNFQSSPTITNCIFWADSPNEIFNNSSSPTISFSNVQGGLGAGSIDGGGNLNLDPLFIDADGIDNIPGTPDDDLRLSGFSPCTDAGDNAATGLFGITTDLDGNPRFYDDLGVVDTGIGPSPIVDMGAYERQVDSVLACPADITPAGGNGVVNIDDLVAVLNGFGACPAPPSSCPADITPPGGNGVVNIDDLVAVLNAFGPCP